MYEEKCSGESEKDENIWNKKKKEKNKLCGLNLIIITHDLKSANQNLKTNSAHNVTLYIITLVFVACLLRLQAFLISTSQSEINRYRLPQFILGLGKNNDPFFMHPRINSRKTTSDVYALEITTAEKSVTISTTNAWTYFRFRGGGDQTNKLLSVFYKVQIIQTLLLFPKCQEVQLILQFNVKLSWSKNKNN